MRGLTKAGHLECQNLTRGYLSAKSLEIYSEEEGEEEEGEDEAGAERMEGSTAYHRI